MSEEANLFSGNYMSEIAGVLKSLEGTCEWEILHQMDEIYSKINVVQSEWFEKSKFVCPSGCGSCCHDFEPDLLECEALYMAAWLLENQKERALSIVNGNGISRVGEKTCPFFLSDNPYHCSIYGGRPSICRLFGASCSRGHENQKILKPCKFFPEDELKKINEKLTHKEYSQEEAEAMFGMLPPAMSDLMEEIVSISPDSNNQTEYIHIILIPYLRKLLWIMGLNK